MGEIFYHGTSRLFDSFDLSHALEGDGKVKFGYGVYVTSQYSSAAHYSGANKDGNAHYVYTVEVPERTSDNWIAFRQPVNPVIVEKANRRLSEVMHGTSVPEKATGDGKNFRIWLGETLKPASSVVARNKSEMTAEDKKLIKLAQEKAASAFLVVIGVDFIEWPYNWKKPEAGTNRAVLDDSKVRVLKIETVELDEKDKLVEGSQKLVKEF